jgi:hypothetical protein
MKKPPHFSSADKRLAPQRGQVRARRETRAPHSEQVVKAIPQENRK